MSMPMYSFGSTVGCVAISYRIWVDNLLINLYYIILDGTRLTAFTWVLLCKAVLLFQNKNKILIHLIHNLLLGVLKCEKLGAGLRS